MRGAIFSTRGAEIWRGAEERAFGDGSRALTLGFPVARANEELENPQRAAEMLAAGMDLAEAAEEILLTVQAAEQLITSLVRGIVPAELLERVPADLVDARQTLQAAINRYTPNEGRALDA